MEGNKKERCLPATRALCKANTLWTFLNDFGRVTEPKEPGHILVSMQYSKEAAI